MEPDSTNATAWLMNAGQRCNARIITGREAIAAERTLLLKLAADTQKH